MTQSKRKKVSLARVLHLVEQLTAEQQEQLRLRLNSSELQGSRIHPFMDWRIDINTLAAQQGVKPIDSIANLKGDFWPEDDLDEFIATLREWRGSSK